MCHQIRRQAGAAALDPGKAKMKLPQAGGCLCGKIRYEITEAPRLVYTCHCTDCQHLTSSAFSIALAVAGFRSERDCVRIRHRARRDHRGRCHRS